MIHYHILTYMTPQAFMEDDDFPLSLPPISLVFEDDSWRQLITRTTQISRRQNYGGMFGSSSSGTSVYLVPAAQSISVDEETWQHSLFHNLKWRASLWF